MKTVMVLASVHFFGAMMSTFAPSKYTVIKWRQVYHSSIIWAEREVLFLQVNRGLKVDTVETDALAVLA